ncbi:MAG: helix-turn-helix transcriptional regulator [Patescibacteria group bacterium]
MKGNHIYKRLGKRICEERTKRGMSQEDLAGISCLHRTHITRIEHGKINPSFSTLNKLARKFKIPVWQLIKGS